MINMKFKLCQVEGCKKIATNTMNTEFEHEENFVYKVPLCSDHYEKIDFGVPSTVSFERIPLEAML